MSRLNDHKTLQAIMFITIKELTLKYPNNQVLGEQVRKLIQDYKLNTNTNG